MARATAGALGFTDEFKHVISAGRVVAQHLDAYQIAKQFSWLKLESPKWIANSFTLDVSFGLKIIVLTLFRWRDHAPPDG